MPHFTNFLPIGIIYCRVSGKQQSRMKFESFLRIYCLQTRFRFNFLVFGSKTERSSAILPFLLYFSTIGLTFIIDWHTDSHQSFESSTNYEGIEQIKHTNVYLKETQLLRALWCHNGDTTVANLFKVSKTTIYCTQQCPTHTKCRPL